MNVREAGWLKFWGEAILGVLAILDERKWLLGERMCSGSKQWPGTKSSGLWCSVWLSVSSSVWVWSSSVNGVSVRGFRDDCAPFCWIQSLGRGGSFKKSPSQHLLFARYSQFGVSFSETNEG
jgi:hypothetical protein